MLSELDIKLNELVVFLDPLNLEVNTKTFGTDLIYRNKIIGIENIKSTISVKSLINGDFSLSGLSISTKSLNIKNLISFIRLVNKDPKILIAEQFIKKGYIIADINLEFDKRGNIKDNYKIKGLVKDGNIKLFKKYNLSKKWVLICSTFLSIIFLICIQYLYTEQSFIYFRF